MAETFPSLAVPTRMPRAFLENQSRSGGDALNGMSQTVASGSERWRLSGSWMVRGKAAILEMERFILAMDGRAGEALVPLCAGKLVNWPVDDYGRVLHPGFTRDKTLDGTVYEDDEVPSESAVTATLNASALLRATTIAVNMTQGSAIQPGQLLSIANKLHRARTISSVVGSVTTMTIRPPLRAAASAGAVVQFDRPFCTMKFATDDQGQDFDPGRGGVVNLDFVESFAS